MCIYICVYVDVVVYICKIPAEARARYIQIYIYTEEIKIYHHQPVSYLPIYLSLYLLSPKMQCIWMDHQLLCVVGWWCGGGGDGARER